MKTIILLLLAASLVAQQPDAKKRPRAEAGDDRHGYTDTPQIPNQKWKVHDAARPRPPLVAPGMPLLNEAPPADAIVLFNGKDLSQWINTKAGSNGVPGWKVENGYAEIVPHSGRIATREKFGDIQLHIEWMVPAGVTGAGQGRGNSGVEIMGRYEIQVLESHVNQTYADGQAGSIYGQWPPLVNATTPQGEWNVYDIYFEAPRFNGDKLEKPAYVTVVHNGILVHHHQEIIGAATHRRVAKYTPHAPEESLTLQDHDQVVRYRNIWIRRLKGYDRQ